MSTASAGGGHFFCSLADTHGSGSTAIVLSGVGGDGAIGIKRIKENGGLTVAQEPGEAEHKGMPRSAIATGMVDWVLPVAEMPRRLLESLPKAQTAEEPRWARRKKYPQLGEKREILILGGDSLTATQKTPSCSTAFTRKNPRVSSRKR
jgi:hypothetical protein